MNSARRGNLVTNIKRMQADLSFIAVTASLEKKKMAEVHVTGCFVVALVRGTSLALIT